MSERLAVVTGGAGGLGRVISGSLARLGLTVVVADRDCDAASGALAELPGSGQPFVAADLSDAAGVRRAV